MSLGKPRPIKTLRLSNEEVQKVLDKLDGAKGCRQLDQRDTTRYGYRAETIIVKVKHPKSSDMIEYIVPTRNLSKGGISILHCSYLHIGTECIPRIIDQNGNWKDVPGKVVRCRYVEGNIHEIAIQFDSFLKLQDFRELLDAPLPE